MNALKILGLLCSFTFLARAAPTPEKSADPEFKSHIGRAKSLVEKVLGYISAVHQSCVSTEGLTIDPSGHPRNSQYHSMVISLGIPKAPELGTTCRSLNQNNLPLEACLSSMSAGLQLYQDVLGVLVLKVTSADKVKELQADIRDLLAQVNKMKGPGQTGSAAQYQASALSARLQGDYEVQVASHFTLLHLRDFTQDLKRSLRNIENLSSKSIQKA
ncbi:uncharacterized protein LOC105007811 [Esox lucius]|nr:uncharacterized protein LOC105007811 [Esox lucius]